MLTLDVGCGKNKHGVIGIDIRRDSEADVVCSVEKLPFMTNIFDGCYAYALLEHVENPKQALTEINRVLKNHSWLKLSVPTDSRLRSDYISDILSLNFKHALYVYRNMKAGEHKWQYREASLKSLLDMTGFSFFHVNYPSSPWIWGRKGKIPNKILTKLKILNQAIIMIQASKQ